MTQAFVVRASGTPNGEIALAMKAFVHSMFFSETISIGLVNEGLRTIVHIMNFCRQDAGDPD